MEVAAKIEKGQRIVYKGDMANCSGEGAVVALRLKPARSGGMFSMILGSGKLIPIDDSVSFDIALEDGRQFCAVYVNNIGGEFSNKSCRFMLGEGVASDEEVAKLVAGVAIKKAADESEAAATAAAFAAAKGEAKAAGVALGLMPEADFKAAGKRGSAAAYNLRAELKKAGIKARVNQDGYDCLRVWVSAEDEAAAEEIGDKYEAGNFDGMTDCYNYAPGAWGEVFGDVKYVFVYVGA